MQVDLVETMTRDGVRLQGMHQKPPIVKESVWPLDGLVFVHGTGGNFYASTMFDTMAARCLLRGCAVLRVNTRGHDGMSTAVTSRGGRRLGAAYEVVDDCRHDLTAWIDWLARRVGPRVGLLGHSLGAVKCLYTLAHEPEVNVQCVVAISPPRLSYSWFCVSPEADQFLDTYRRANALVQANEPAALLDVQLPLPFVIAAAGFVEKYGPDERYNYLKFLTPVRVPTLVTLGEREVANNMAFRSVPDELRAIASDQTDLTMEIIPLADHFYSQCRDMLLDNIDFWLSSHFRSTS